MTEPAEDLAALKAFALRLPGAWEDAPWDGEPVTKVGKKIFVFYGPPQDPSIAVKLPESSELARGLPGAAPTGYGLGRWSWVTVPVGTAEAPADVLEDWIEESYRAVAPRKLVAELEERGPAGS